MKRKVISSLLAVVMLTIATAGVFAKGQPKTNICHLDDNGQYNLIIVAEPAVDKHIAHGDSVAGTNGLDESCNPVDQMSTLCQQLDGFSGTMHGGTNRYEFPGTTLRDEEIVTATFSPVSDSQPDGDFVFYVIPIGSPVPIFKSAIEFYVSGDKVVALANQMDPAGYTGFMLTAFGARQYNGSTFSLTCQ